MARAIQLVGVDCGSTTTSLVAATAQLTSTSLGRVEISQLAPHFQSEIVFTPFAGEAIDEAAVAALLDGWLRAAQLDPAHLFGGGALVTGLAAERSNAAAVARLIESRLSDAIIAVAHDPRLEAWLAFMGNCHERSLAEPNRTIINLDIGGGTTNLACGQAGQVTATGSLMIGARHFQFEPGGYRLRGTSRYGRALLDALGIRVNIGDELSAADVRRICQWYVDLLCVTLLGERQASLSPVQQLHVQAPLGAIGEFSDAMLTLSGGVSALAYALLAGERPLGPAHYGDLGGELAASLIDSPVLRPRLAAKPPKALGRATVLGLLCYSTEVSGSTCYLPDASLLPLANVPIVGRIDAHTSDALLAELVQLAGSAESAGCLQVDLDASGAEALTALAARLAGQLEAAPWPAGRTLVLLTPGNVGKALGSYITLWRTLPVRLIVIDEVPLRDAQYVRLGRPLEGVVPVSLHTLR